MKLVDTRTNSVEVEYQDNITLFSNKYLEREMAEIGISIPPFLVADYKGRRVIKKGDPLFQQAFKDIYYFLNMDSERYKWSK
jgi:hypothetical protein